MERIKKLLKSEQPVKWIFEGDSITHGALHTFGWRDCTEHFTERIRFKLGRMRDIVIKSLISGHTTCDMLNDIDWRMKQFQSHRTRSATREKTRNESAETSAINTEECSETNCIVPAKLVE